MSNDVWAVLPRGIPGNPPKVYKLKRALYELKQAHLAWHTKLCKDLKKIFTLRFSELSCASCVFLCGNDLSRSFVLVYVNHMLVIGKIKDTVEKTVTSLKNFYDIRRSENVDLFIGVSLKWNFNGNEIIALQLSQKTYITSSLRHFGMNRCKEAVTSMVEKFLLERTTTNTVSALTFNIINR